MTVYIQTPFDNIPAEGCRAMRYWNMTEAFVAAGHEVVLFISSFNHGTKARRKFDDSLKIEIDSPKFKVYRYSSKVQVVVLNTIAYKCNVSLRRVLSHILYARSFCRTAKTLLSDKVISQPSAVISAVPTLSAALAGINLSRRLGAKSVSDIQDAWPEAFSRILPNKLKFLSSFLFLPMSLMAKAIYRSSDMLSGVSSAYGKLTGRNDYYLSRLGISVKSLPKKSNPSSRSISRLVYVGSLGIGYDLETVIDALKIDSFLSLDIAGEGERKEAICRYAEKCGVSERVRFHGWLGAEELSSLISSCDAGIIPMSDESMVALPNKFFDYLSSSLPVITSLHGECAEILLGENMGVIYEEKSAQSFLRAVESLRLNPPKHVFLSDSLRADKIYPKFVREVEKSLLENNRR